MNTSAPPIGVPVGTVIRRIALAVTVRPVLTVGAVAARRRQAMWGSRAYLADVVLALSTELARVCTASSPWRPWPS